MQKITVAVMLFLSISIGYSQNKKDVEFGFNIGYNSSQISGFEGDSDTGTGINIGASADYYFSDTWSIKAKLIYDQKGWDNDVIQDSNTGNYYPTNFNVNYITLPVMANWHFGNSQNWYLNFGPYFGFLLNAKDTNYKTNVTDAFNSNDFGLALGIGVKLPVSDKIKIFFEYEGQGGMSDIFKNSDYSEITNSRSSINVGINFLMK